MRTVRQRHPHRPLSTSTPYGIDIVIGRCAWHVMVATARRKTPFPTCVATSSTKAKPPADATAFCVLSLPYLILGVVAFAIGLLIFLLRQRLRLIATPLPFRDALRRAGDLRFRVAGGAYRLRCILLPPSGGRDDTGGCHLKSGGNRDDGRVWHHDIS